MYDQFFGAPGEVMTTKKTTLDDMLDQVFIKIIAGQEPLESFDSVVEQWKTAGGQDYTDAFNLYQKQYQLPVSHQQELAEVSVP